MGLLAAILVVATILGGLAAIAYFWEKFRAKARRPPPTSPTPSPHSPRPATPHPADVELFERIRGLLPFEPVGRFLKEHDFAGAFHIHQWAGIHDYVSLSDSPEWRFMDSALEAVRLRLATDLNAFLRAAVGKVWDTGDHETLAVPGGWLSRSHSRHGDYWPAVELLNNRARKAYQSYELLVRQGRSRLGVSASA